MEPLLVQQAQERQRPPRQALCKLWHQAHVGLTLDDAQSLWCLFSAANSALQDLAKALGINCVVFNCGENLDFKFMGKFFAGGAWPQNLCLRP